MTEKRSIYIGQLERLYNIETWCKENFGNDGRKYIKAKDVSIIKSILESVPVRPTLDELEARYSKCVGSPRRHVMSVVWKAFDAFINVCEEEGVNGMDCLEIAKEWRTAYGREYRNTK